MSLAPVEYAPAVVCTEDAITGLHEAVRAQERAVQREYDDAHRIIAMQLDTSRLQMVYQLFNGQTKRGPADDRRLLLSVDDAWSPHYDEQFKAYNA